MAWSTAWTAIRYALFALAFAPLAYYVVALFAASCFFAARRLPPASPNFAPGVSILKPVYGLDRETYQNYASLCTQAYPQYEILFCAGDEHDPAVGVIRQIIQNFPDRAIRLLVGSEPLGVSDKVNKLCRLAREAKFDIESSAIATSASTPTTCAPLLRPSLIRRSAESPPSIAVSPTADSPPISKPLVTAPILPPASWFPGFSLM
jgi:cellulose synthase/poly-beta-1,6-N-acetylglucosamine synthase-like glycosyltransferase